MFEHPEYDGHEELMFAHDEASGLRAIVALHSTRLGPAGGGIRMYPYPSEAEAITDVLRLSKGMSNNMAIAGVPFGGGKSVIIGDPKTDKSEALLLAFGDLVERLAPRYICGEDVGTNPADMSVIARRTGQVLGLPGKSGDPSPTTARTVHAAMRAAVRHRDGRTLDGLTVAVQGIGHVGRVLCDLLAEDGAHLLVADVDEAAVAWAADRHGARIVDPDQIHRTEADVLAPCALGGTLHAATIGEIRAGVVCGSANNQLSEPDDAARLAARQILYVPDYVANVGGVYSATTELDGHDRDLDEAVAAVGARVTALLERSTAERVTPSEAADRLAADLIAAG